VQSRSVEEGRMFFVFSLVIVLFLAMGPSKGIILLWALMTSGVIMQPRSFLMYDFT
jgi:hypothetical protein